MIDGVPSPEACCRECAARNAASAARVCTAFNHCGQPGGCSYTDLRDESQSMVLSQGQCECALPSCCIDSLGVFIAPLIPPLQAPTKAPALHPAPTLLPACRPAALPAPVQQHHHLAAAAAGQGPCHPLLSRHAAHDVGPRGGGIPAPSWRDDRAERRLPLRGFPQVGPQALLGSMQRPEAAPWTDADRGKRGRCLVAGTPCPSPLAPLCRPETEECVKQGTLEELADMCSSSWECSSFSYRLGERPRPCRAACCGNACS